MKTTRRDLFFGTTAATLLAALPQAQAQSVKMLTATTRNLDIDGKAAKVFALLGPDGQPGVTLNPGERFAVTLNNRNETPTIVHWHGQLPDWKQDGFPWPQTPPIRAGMSKDYDYAPIPGTFWMHSHEGMQEQQLMAAPLIVRDAASAFADAQEVVLLLHDFSFKAPEELMAGLTKKGGMMSRDMGSMNGMSMSAGGMRNMNMGSGGMMGAPDLNDIDFDAYLANERTLRDPQVIRAARGQPIRLRIINGASSTNFWIDLGQLSGKIIAVDGHDVAPVIGSHFPIAIAQRLDILVSLPPSGAYPVFAQVEGKKDRTGIILATPGASIGTVSEQAAMAAPAVDLTLESRLKAAKPLAVHATDLILPLKLGGDMSNYVWPLNGKAWPNPEVLMVKSGQRVMIDMVNDSMMSHPMHLHGHAFQVVAINNKPIDGALRDTVLVPAMGSVRIAFDANNPGRWALHCHNMYHMAAGMMTEIRYPGIV